MAKKSSAHRHTSASGASAKRSQGAGSARSDAVVRFDDSAYQNVRFSATFDYDELALTRAASLLIEKGRPISLGVAFCTLAGLVGMLWINKDLLIPALFLMVISIVASAFTNSWPKVQRRYADKTTLALTSGAERRHIVVCDDALYATSSTLQAQGEPAQVLPLSELRTFESAVDFVVIGFGNKRYVYIPRTALSDARYRELSRYLDEWLEKNHK